MTYNQGYESLSNKATRLHPQPERFPFLSIPKRHAATSVKQSKIGNSQVVRLADDGSRYRTDSVRSAPTYDETTLAYSTCRDEKQGVYSIVIGGGYAGLQSRLVGGRSIISPVS